MRLHRLIARNPEDFRRQISALSFFCDAKVHHAAPDFIIKRRIVDAEFVMQRRISSYSAESEIAPNSSADSDSALYDNHPAPNYSAALFWGLLPTCFKKAVSTRGRAHRNLESAGRKQLRKPLFTIGAMQSRQQGSCLSDSVIKWTHGCLQIGFLPAGCHAHGMT